MELNMKWKNKGHEFDQVFQHIQNKKTFWIFGAGMAGKRAYGLLHDKIKIDGFLDNDRTKQACSCMGQKVIAVEALNHTDKDIGIIVCTLSNNKKDIIEQLENAGEEYNKDFFIFETFVEVWWAYQRNELYFHSISFLPLTKCSLNCEACLNFTPYIKNAEIRPLDMLKESIDLFFRAVDYCALFHISGGEPMLYPHMAELVEYIGENYGNRIYELQTSANGTVLPKPEVLETFVKYHVFVALDDYRESVPRIENTFRKIEDAFKKYGVDYAVYKDKWIDLAPMTTDHSGFDDVMMQDWYSKCHCPWSELRNGKIYHCNYSSYAKVAGLTEEQDGEFFDLHNYDKSQLKELMEFDLGYNEKGYVEFCRHCSGFVGLNTNIIPSARQKGR